MTPLYTLFWVKKHIPDVLKVPSSCWQVKKLSVYSTMGEREKNTKRARDICRTGSCRKTQAGCNAEYTMNYMGASI